MKTGIIDPDPAAAQEAPVSITEHFLRGNLFSEQCPSREVLQHVTSRWGVIILVALLTGTHRFSELRHKIGGVSEKMLAQSLRWLESDGFVIRYVHPVMPPHVEYSLTPQGREVGARVRDLVDWIELNLPHILDAKANRQAAPAPTLGITKHRLR